MKRPFLYKGTTPVPVRVEDVFELTKTIINGGREAEFVALCKANKVSLLAAPETVNFVKNYLFDSQAFKISEVAGMAIRSAQCDPPA
jgi:hypothetical protein